jgi:hypothetical protein
MPTVVGTTLGAGKLVTVIIEDTCYRILHGEEELAVKPRKDTSPVTQLYLRGMKPSPNAGASPRCGRPGPAGQLLGIGSGGRSMVAAWFHGGTAT